MKRESNKESGLTNYDKILIFLFAPFYIFFGGVRSFYHLPGNGRQNKQALITYFLGLAFWIIIVFGIFYVIEVFE